MYHMTEDFLKGESKLFEKLHQIQGETTGQKVIMGGHYMLAYDQEKKRLIPMIWQDIENEKLKKQSISLAGDFPVYTFALGLKLIKQVPQFDSSKVLLLINDHIFTSLGEPFCDKDSSNAGLLRKEYFDKSEIPFSFNIVLQNLGFENNNIILENNDVNRNPQSILPHSTKLFSEQFLRNEFGRKTINNLYESNYFTRKISGDKKQMIFSPWGNKNGEICLLESGGCGCAGETIQLILSLFEQNLNEIVLFVPEECSIAVNQGIKAALHYISQDVLVTVITGLSRCFDIGNIHKNDESVIFETKIHRWTRASDEYREI